MYKTHRQNHDFQIAYFLAGKCHTPDGAYALLNDLRDDRVAAIAAYRVNRKRAEAKRIRIGEVPATTDAAALDRDADLMELDNAAQTGEVLFDAAVDELAFINRLIGAIKPHCKYRHLPDHQAFEAAQQEEWLFELIERAENMMFCHGTLSPDHLTTMRAHPQFQSVILPAITAMADAVRNGGAIALVGKRPGNEALIGLLEKSLLATLPGPC